MTLAIDRHCSQVALYFQSNGSNHCNTCGIFYHLSNCVENHVDLAAEETVVFHLVVYHFKINLVTKTIMKNYPLKIKCVKGFV